MEYAKKVLQLFCIFQSLKDKRNSKNMLVVKASNKENQPPNSKRGSYDINEEQKLSLAALPHQLGVPAPNIQHQAAKKLLLLDLDRTLIYFNEKIGLLVRPYLNQFLNELKPLFTIYIFTAATTTYASKILQMAKNEAPSLNEVAGVLTREHCIKVTINPKKLLFIKDLNILSNCLLENILIVDDSPVSYCLNKENAIPIAPFYGYEGDDHLQSILPVLKQAHQFQDVRHFVQKKYFDKNILKISAQNRILTDKTNSIF